MPKYLSTDPNEGLSSKYLSTDPNEGLTSKYLSTDPNEGLDAPEEAPGILGRSANMLGRFTSTLGRLGAATAASAKEGLEGYQQGQPLADIGADIGQALKDTFTPGAEGLGSWKRTDDFDDVLGQAGMQEGWKRAALGFVGDVAIDPLNLVPGALLAKGIKLPFKATAAVAKKIPGVNTMVDTASSALNKAFVPYAGMEKFRPHVDDGLTLQDKLRLVDSSQRHESEAATTIAEALMGKKGMTGIGTRKLKADEATRVLHAVDRGVTDLGDARLNQAAQEVKQVMRDQLQTKLDMGSITPEQIVENYIPYQTTTASKDAVESVSGAQWRGKTASDKPRKTYTSLEQAVKVGGASESLPEVISKSVAQTQKAKRTNEFLIKTATEFGHDTTVAGGRKLNRQMMNVPDKTWQALEGKHFPKEVADQLEKAVQLWEKPSEIDGLAKTGMKIWKSLATSINPGHHATNFYGNLHNMYIGGMSTPEIARGYREGWKIARQKTAQAFPSLTVGKKTYSKSELFKLANDYEIIGTSNILADLGETTADKVANNRVFKVGRQFGTRFMEEPARVGMWLHEIRKGKTPEQAAIRVKNVLFDYAELTPFEKKFRDLGLVPFYTWMRKNIPYQLQSMAENPKKFERVKDMMNVPWNAHKARIDETVIPEDSERAGYVPGTMEGPNDELVFHRLNLPSNDLNKMNDPKLIGDSLGPLFKIAVEKAMGQKFYGGPIETSSGLTSPSPPAAILGAVLNRFLPESLEGIITPKTDVIGRPRQYDTMSWLMSAMIPTGVYGSTAKMMQGEDPLRPNLPLGRTTGLRAIGLSPDVLSSEDQKFEVLRRQQEWAREYRRKALLER